MTKHIRVGATGAGAVVYKLGSDVMLTENSIPTVLTPTVKRGLRLKYPGEFRWGWASLLMVNANNFHGRPVGNSPEMMPMDCTLNKDIIDCFERHVAATYSTKESTDK